LVTGASPNRGLTKEGGRAAFVRFRPSYPPHDYPMKITIAKVRIAWIMLVILAIISYPATYVGPFSVTRLLMAFLPGGAVRWTARGRAGFMEGRQYRMNQPTGGSARGGAFVLATLVGLTFNPFVAFALTGLFCSLVWSLDVLFGATAWEKGLVGLTLA